MKFKRVMAFVLRWEGGYVDHPDDPGGRTDKGVSERSHPEAWADDTVTLEEAYEIYREKYWNPIGGDDRPFAEALAIMDFAVHSGVSRALNTWEQSDSVYDYILKRYEFLQSLSNYSVFGTGWRNRIVSLLQHVSNPLDDTGLIQMYVNNRRFDFVPEKVNVGQMNSGRTKIMARLH